jgi:hypothetical protein
MHDFIGALKFSQPTDVSIAACLAAFNEFFLRESAQRIERGVVTRTLRGASEFLRMK